MTKLYQLRVGAKQLPLSSCMLRGGGSELVDFAYSFWLVDHPLGLTLVDSGFHEPAARRKSIAYERTAVQALALLGIAPTDVGAIVLTHLHFDHAGSLADFPGATVYLQRSELEYFTGPLMRFPLCASGLDKEDLAAALAAQSDGRLALLDGDAEVLPGVDVIHVGGHTPGSQLVSVSDGQRRIILTADAAHTYANLEAATPFPVLHDVPSSCIAFERIAALADDTTSVIPGHDGAVAARFPSVGGTGGAVLTLL
jgi:glyoxylase-like metal-dependent hydrolase (beta-lactamase superfamily II)